MNQKPRIAIAGAGLGGLVLALALDKHVGVKATVYEGAKSFDSNAGGAVGLYPNGLRVLRDISPGLLDSVRTVAFPYLYRRWMRHDGSEVACAKESYLCAEESELQSVGVRRWLLQKVLCDACHERGIVIHFNHRVKQVSEEGDVVTVDFESSASAQFDIVFGADGVKSKVRQWLHGEMTPEYTGITCLMGASKICRPFRGICFPSSTTSKCHACYYPTGNSEQVFQIFFTTDERPETWGNLSIEEAQKECHQLAKKLKDDGWHRDFIDPILNSESVLRVGLRAREPLDKWVKGRVVLLGDAAHPPVPYIGQGAMMAFEDAGVIALLLMNYCLTNDGFNLSGYNEAMTKYEEIRIPRTRAILGASKTLGASQQQRADSWLYNWSREWWIWLQVQLYGTLPIMLPGATFNYTDDIAATISQ